MPSRFEICLASTLLCSPSLAQTFECVIEPNELGLKGVAVYGTNDKDRTWRCDISCPYNTEVAQVPYHCRTQMQPNSDRTKYCFEKAEGAVSIVSEQHECH